LLSNACSDGKFEYIPEEETILLLSNFELAWPISMLVPASRQSKINIRELKRLQLLAYIPL
jgi:hypothetical protein